MRVKRFVANSMQEAIALVKADFGHEAVILHTKRIRKGGFFGLFGRVKVEVIAATDAPGRRQRSAAARSLAGRPASSPNGALESAAASELAEVRKELDHIKRALQSAHSPGAPVLPPACESVRAALIEQEVQEDLARELLASVQSKLSAKELQDEERVRRETRAALAAGIACADPWQLGEDAKVQCLIGPTGVGKTTTIAKLAANYSLLGKKRVALITVDTYRIAAVEQLKTYAEIIDVPVDVAFTPGELKQAVDRRKDYDLILVDTAGRSQKNKMQMAELRAFLEVFDAPQVHLVLSATTKERDMLDIVEQFGRIPISYLIATKLDETSTYGMLYNLCRLTGKPLSYVTTGQSVPDDIEVAESERIADMIMGVTR